MDFKTLHETIPYAMLGKEKSLKMEPYKGITLAMPGRHAKETVPKGGDFVVMVTDPGMKWKNHQFKHSDIFNDIQTKYDHDKMDTFKLLQDYHAVVRGGVPVTWTSDLGLPGVHPTIFLQAVQCLAVAEHRRYAQHEAKFGGRFLPFRFVAGIAEGLWTADHGTEVQKYGRPAVERLEAKNGVPQLTEELMSV